MQKQITNIVIRPAARGGKYLGHDAADSDNQSAVVALVNPNSGGNVAHGLAEAPTPASAGPPNLMDPVSRSEPFATDGDTVQVQLSVEIAEPTVLRVLVFGPLSYPDQARLAQADITVLPGVDIGTDPMYPEGLVIEIPGLCISNVSANLQGPQFNCNAKVTMMCGCPIGNETPWPWPYTDFHVTLVTRTQSGALYNYPLSFVQTPPKPNHNSLFAGQWTNQAPGDPVVEAWIYASEPKLGNQGKYRAYPSPLPPALPSELQGIYVLPTSD
ncbi:MAG: hypothetical protein ACKVQW_14060 [Pyrinomonadaceae bacterium]